MVPKKPEVLRPETNREKSLCYWGSGRKSVGAPQSVSDLAGEAAAEAGVINEYNSKCSESTE